MERAMIGILSSLFGQVWPGLAIAGALIAAALGIRLSGKTAGREEARREVERQNQQARETRDVSVAEIDSMDDDAVRARARQRMRDAGAG
jgi:cell division protein FtsB